MSVFMLFGLLLFLLVDISYCGGLAQSDSSDTTQTGLQPSNAHVSCLNLNYSLHWDPPKSSSPADSTLYTVFYFISWPSRWVEVPSCINITDLSCYIFPVFNNPDQIYLDLKVSVRTIDELGNLGAPVNITFNPITNATVGAPIVHLNKITAEEAVIRLTPPISPFDGKYVTNILTEPDIKYNVSLWKVVDPQTLAKISEQSVASSSGTEYLTNLDPDTTYNLHVYTLYKTIFVTKQSPVTIFSFRTNQKKPDRGPEIRLGSETSPNCAKANLRNITIHWKAPPANSMNGKITNYTIEWREKGSSATTQTTTVDEATFLYTIQGLSRWKTYEVSVSATNNGGATPSSWLTIRTDMIDISKSEPVELIIESHNDSSIQLVWQHPTGFTECIAGYTITYQWQSEDGPQTRQASVNDATFYIIAHMEPVDYKIEVSADIVSGFNNFTRGKAAGIDYHQTDTYQQIYENLAPIVIVLVLVIIVSFGLWGVLWKRNRLKRILGLHNLFNLDADNKILQFAQNYAGSGTPTKTIEPEFFDAIVISQHYPSCTNTCLDRNCTCDRFHPSDLSQKLAVDIGANQAERSLQELPVVTPDIGCSLLPIFPDFSAKSTKTKTNKEDKGHRKVLPIPSEGYSKVGLNTNSACEDQSGIMSSLSMNDLYLRSTSVESTSESSQLLPDDDKGAGDHNDDLDLYFQVSQLPKLGKSKYSRLNSYSDTDIPSASEGCASDSNGTTLGKEPHDKQVTDTSAPIKYANRPVYGKFHDTSDFGPEFDDKKTIVLKTPPKTMDPYPYSKMAFGEDYNHSDLDPSFVLSDNKNFKQMPGCALDFTNNNDDRAAAKNTLPNICIRTFNDLPLTITDTSNTEDATGQSSGHVQTELLDHRSLPTTPIKDEIDPYIMLSQL